ncbi:SAM-dependent methyltransferase [Luedemannella flava]|uniref:SAM-dependent methyltransferase n=1 Tax=Luedemannella flava TaxID=349316 RepID=A0ABP4Y9D7_9ACTN
MLEPMPFDPDVPNVARMYDYYLGGTDNFAADRAAADQALTVAPELRVGAQEGRKFLSRAVTYLARDGIRQFLDVGCGLPTRGNVHEVARAVTPAARVVYVDNDPMVVAHARALLGTHPTTAVVEADLRDPESLLGSPAVKQMINFREPVGLLLFSVLHLVPDDELAHRVVRRLREQLAPGSYLAIAHAVADLRPETTARLAALYQDKTASAGPRRPNLPTRDQVLRYFDGLELVEPGLVYVPRWRPDPDDEGPGDTPVWSVGGVARTP